MTNALDRITAERVMGWTVRKNDDENGYSEIYSSGWAVDKWCPSTDPRFTFAVVDALRADGYWLSHTELGGRCVVSFIERGPNGTWSGRIVQREHKDRLTAILLAANAVKGVSDEEVQAAIKEGA